MKKRLCMGILAGALVVTTAMPVVVMAGQGGRMNRGGAQVQSGNRIGTQERLRDGSCVTGTASQSGSMTRSGKTYGPGDGTGYQGTGPRDGTGYGAPGNR